MKYCEWVLDRGYSKGKGCGRNDSTVTRRECGLALCDVHAGMSANAVRLEGQKALRLARQRAIRAERAKGGVA